MKHPVLTSKDVDGGVCPSFQRVDQQRRIHRVLALMMSLNSMRHIGIAVTVVLLATAFSQLAVGAEPRRYFSAPVYNSLSSALNEAERQRKPIFLLIYESRAHKNTPYDTDYWLGYFTKYEATKSLLRESFIQVVLPNDKADAQKFGVGSLSMGAPAIVILNSDGSVVTRAEARANPDEGLRLAQKLVAATKPKVDAKKVPISAPVQPAVVPLSNGLVLGKVWDSPAKTGSLTIEDFINLLTPLGKPGVDIGPHPEIVIYKNVPYLAPVSNAMSLLGLKGSMPSKDWVTCPGWPVNSFGYYSFDGKFEEHYNRLILVVDNAEQVVAIELVDESPEKYSTLGRDVTVGRWHTYDFVQMQRKLDATGLITQTPEIVDRNRTLKIDGKFYNPPTANNPPLLKEEVRLYCPRPIYELILHYCKLSQ